MRRRRRLLHYYGPSPQRSIIRQSRFLQTLSYPNLTRSLWRNSRLDARCVCCADTRFLDNDLLRRSRFPKFLGRRASSVRPPNVADELQRARAPSRLRKCVQLVAASGTLPALRRLPHTCVCESGCTALGARILPPIRSSLISIAYAARCFSRLPVHRTKPSVLGDMFMPAQYARFL